MSISIGTDVILSLPFCLNCGEMVGAFSGTVIGESYGRYKVQPDRDAFATPCRCTWPVILMYDEDEINELLWVL